MGVYIKGLEMPKSCDECRIMVFEDTNCVPELFCGCPIVFQAHPQGVGYRPDYCPLVPVPKHGRLIDADALYNIFLELAQDEWNQNTNCSWAAGYADAMEITENAPTIIPAEEGEA